MAETANFPSIDEIAQTEGFPTVIWQLEPHREGMLPVAVGRGGPFNIHWEVHGDGPVKLVLINGMGALKSSWQRQTKEFGHVNGDKYSVLIFDNRGMGRSDKPLMRYSTSDMAADTLEVLDHLSWTKDREIHICGISMGGMIAQELAYAAPHRIASLSLICTAAAIENTTSFTENLMNRITMLIPKSLDRTVAYTATNLFPAEWLAAADDAAVPDEATPRCAAPGAEVGWPYRRFRSNYERVAAQELAKQRDPDPAAGFARRGFLLQAVAAGWHRKSAAQLRAVGDAVGRARIAVVHGTADRVISVPHGRRLIGYLEPGRGLVVDGMGHVPLMERTEWFNGLLAEMCATGERLSGR